MILRKASVCIVALLIAVPTLRAAAPVYSNSFLAVTLDGVRLGTDLDASNLSLMPSVVSRPGSRISTSGTSRSDAA